MDYFAIKREMALKEKNHVEDDKRSDEEKQDIINRNQDKKQDKISDPNEKQFHEILNDENLNIPYRGDMRMVKILADDISEMKEMGQLPTLTTRDVVLDLPEKEDRSLQKTEKNLEDRINNEKNKKTINNIKDLLQEKNEKFNELPEDAKNNLTTYMQEKMDIIEPYIIDENEGGKRKKHRRSRKKTSHKRKTKKHNKRKTKRRRKTKTKH